MIVALWGPEKSWKSTFALSFPYPLFHMELDIGGFERAAWRFTELRIRRCQPDEKIKDIDWSQYDIVTKPYPIPIQMEKMLGAKAVVTDKGPTVRFPREVVGYKEIWQQIVIDYVAACQSPLVQSINPDSATQLWVICHTGLLQEKQEIQMAKGMKPTHSDFRERLQPVEFPNDRMRSLIYTARSYHKNLILTHYPKDVYKDKVTDKGIEAYRSGDITPDGFKDTQKLADIIIWVDLDSDNNVQAQITRCGLEGLGTSATGLSIEPSYEGILKLQASMRGE